MDILVLVCALGVAAPDCQPETAIHSFYAGAPQSNPAGCLRDGMVHAAQSGLVVAGTYPKVVCNPRTRLTKQLTDAAGNRPFD
jgi:hypothetical protein